MSAFENLEFMFIDGDGPYGFPMLSPTYETPDMNNWIEFDYAKRTTKDREHTGIHFFEYDCKFMRLWDTPNKYINLLSQFGCMIQTDYSMYRDMPKAMQIWNKYRNHWLAVYYQRQGIQVIPNIGWSTPDNYDWQFDGYPKNSVVAVSNVGCMREKEARELFNRGYNEMIDRLEPSEILMFAHKMDDYKGNVRWIHYSMDKGVQL